MRTEERSNLLTLRKQQNGNLLLIPTAEGVVTAKEFLEARQEESERGGGTWARHSQSSQVYEMLGYFFGNGWLEVLPEHVGALTSALIISDDGTIPDEGGWGEVEP